MIAWCIAKGVTSSITIATCSNSDSSALARRSSLARGSDSAGSSRRRTNDEFGDVVGCTEDGRGNALI
jgi:hypothetical protein